MSRQSQESIKAARSSFDLFNMVENGDLHHSEFVQSELDWWDWFYGCAIVLFFLLLIGASMTTLYLWRLYERMPHVDEGVAVYQPRMVIGPRASGGVDVMQSPLASSAASSELRDSERSTATASKMKSFFGILSSTSDERLKSAHDEKAKRSTMSLNDAKPASSPASTDEGAASMFVLLDDKHESKAVTSASPPSSPAMKRDLSASSRVKEGSDVDPNCISCLEPLNPFNRSSASFSSKTEREKMSSSVESLPYTSIESHRKPIRRK